MNPCPPRTAPAPPTVRAPARTSPAGLVRPLARFGAPLLLALWLAPAHGIEPERVGLDGEPIDTSLELRVDIYSPSAVELFWNRMDVPGVRYEVRRNGEPLADTDGTSLYVDGLAGGRDHDFDVVAVVAGERVSEVASVAVTTPVDAGATREPDGAGDTLDLRAETYSSTTAELFWSPIGGDGIAYEVRADGVVLATVVGTSHFHECVVPGEPTTFEVVAVDDAGRVRATESITVHDPTVSLGTSPWSAPPGCFPATAPTSRFEGIVPFDPVIEADLDGTVDEPLELRVEVYSDSAIELFWNRIPGDDVRYDVIIGPYFVTSTGTSQFADGLDLASAGVAGVIAYESGGELLSAQFTYVPF